jgi:hypothetical protein
VSPGTALGALVRQPDRRITIPSVDAIFVKK